MTPGQVWLTVDGVRVAPVELATTAGARRRGLVGRDRLDGAIWLHPANQVHGIRMRFDLDVAFVDRAGIVLRTAVLRRNRMTPLVWRSRTVIEAQAGRFSSWGLRPGVRVGHEG